MKDLFKFFRKLQKPSEEKQKPTSSVDKQPRHSPVNQGRTSQGKPLQDSKSTNNIVNKPIIPQNKPSVTISKIFLLYKEFLNFPNRERFWISSQRLTSEK